MSAPRKPSGRKRRSYESPLRRQRAAETRERIVAAGAELIHGFPVWNWRALTIPAVARRAAVNTRTVYRHFPGERELRDAVMTRLETEAGVDLHGLRLQDLRSLTTRVFEYVASFPVERRTPRDPTLAAAHARQRRALLSAVRPLTADWPAADRVIAAALLDVQWSVASFERLVADWKLGDQGAVAGITWVLGLIENAIRSGQRPSGSTLGAQAPRSRRGRGRVS